MNPLQIAVIGLMLAALAYLIWWARRAVPARRGQQVAARASQTHEWPPDLIESFLEYGRFLDPQSSSYSGACLGLARQAVDDPRARYLFDRYLREHTLTQENAVVASRLAQLISPQPANSARAVEVARAIEVLDRLSEVGFANDNDILLRARFALHWVDVSAPAIRATHTAWRQLQGTPEAEPLSGFLYDYLTAVWDIKTSVSTPAPSVDITFLQDAAAVFCAMADTPPSNLTMRRQAAESTFEIGDYLACFAQCIRMRDEFGAPRLDADIWRMWAHSVVRLEGQDWPAYASGHMAHVPAGTSWERLREVFARATETHASDPELLAGQVWTTLGAQVPIAQALTIYERALSRAVVVVPALEQLVDYYYHAQAWPDLERTARTLLPLQTGEESAQTAHRLAEALLNSNQLPDVALLERVFDHDPSHPLLNAALIKHYLAQPKLQDGDMARIDHLLQSPLPTGFSIDDLQVLRERFAISWLHRDKGAPPSLADHVSRYLVAGGANLGLLRWAAEKRVGNDAQRQTLLETLVQQRPVERQYVLDLAGQYAASSATEAQMVMLADAAHALWSTRAKFDEADCRVAQLIDAQVPLAADDRHKLVIALLRTKPAGWQTLAAHHLVILLDNDQVDTGLLQMVLAERFAPEDPDPLHVRTLEAMMKLRDEPVDDGLRLLALYEVGRGRNTDGEVDVQQKGASLAEYLAKRYLKAGRQQRSQLFPPLLRWMMSQSVPTPFSWAVDLLVTGQQDGYCSSGAEVRQFASQTALYLATCYDLRAIRLQHWVYTNGRHSSSDAAQLLIIAHTLQQTSVQDPFWFEVARAARTEVDAVGIADAFLVEYLLTQQVWSQDIIETARQMLVRPFREDLATAFVSHVAYGHSRQDNRVLIDILDDKPVLGRGRAELLSALAETREKRGNYEGALEACLLWEDSVGPSEELARRILQLLPYCGDRAQYADRLRNYVPAYRTSFDLIAQMVTLARDPSRPLPFDQAYAIVDLWGDLAAKQDVATAGYASDASFVAASKCEIYDLYRDQITPDEAQLMLRSIAKHSRQNLSPETRRRIESIGDSLLSQPGQDHMTRQIVAELLYNLGNLPGATWQFEQLTAVPEYHRTAVESLGRIARQLESPRREVHALLTAYRCMADDAYQAGQMDAAETVVRRAKPILLDTSFLEELTKENRTRAAVQQDALLKLYQTILLAHQRTGSMTEQQKRDLADVCRVRELWDQAGALYSELAAARGTAGDRAGALECAERVFDCYYKAGKGWWDPAARYLLRILTGRETVPPEAIASRFNEQERRILEYTALLYHSLCVDPVLQLDPAIRIRYRNNARQLYERLPLEHHQTHPYIQILSHNINLGGSTILEPFDLVPYIRERGKTEIWTATPYEKLDRIGSGEFAEVFKVKKTRTDEIYAMKLITSAKGRDPRVQARFEREGQWLKDLDHPNIVKCYDAGVQEDRQFIIMDYVEGQTLDDLITRRRRELTLQQSLRIFLSICSAVEFLHNQTILHRDLHPGNVLIGGPAYEVVKLTDFGLATMMDREGVGKSSRIHGRENYTPPEVYNKQAESTASEVYSLGAILCFMLSGYPHPDTAVLRELKTSAYAGLGEVIERALSNDAAARYQRVTELIHEVRQRANIQYDYGAILQRVTPLRIKQMFEFGPILGQGESGSVYRARDLRSPNAPDVAIKEIASDRVRGSLERRAEHFFRVRDLSHENIVQLQTFFRVDGKLYIVMDLVDGPSLATRLEANEAQSLRFSPDTGLRIVGDVARGLAFVHQHGIVHGCVVPTNILIDQATQRASLSDFAASVLFDGDQWHKSALVRQYTYYLAPEISQGESVSPASDVYSLGWLLCHVATGQRGQLNLNEVIASLEETGHWSVDTIDHAIQLIEGSTVLDPMRRVYPDAGAFLAELTRIL